MSGRTKAIHPIMTKHLGTQICTVERYPAGEGSVCAAVTVRFCTLGRLSQ
jgi:hypothetical protein